MMYNGPEIQKQVTRRILKISRILNTLYKPLVRSLLECCCPLWDPVKLTEIQHLEGVERTLTNRIGGLENINYRERQWHCSAEGNGVPF